MTGTILFAHVHPVRVNWFWNSGLSVALKMNKQKHLNDFDFFFFFEENIIKES